MNGSGKRKRPAIGPLLLVVWFGAMLVWMPGCASAPESSTQGAIDRLAKAQGGQAALEQQNEALLSRSMEQRAEALRVQAVTKRWIEAQGGHRRLEKLQNVQCLMRVEEGFNHSFVRTVELADGRYRYELMIGSELSISGGFDGQRSWQDGGSWGAGVYPAQRGDPYWSLYCLRSLQLAKAFPVQRCLPDEKVEGRMCAVLGLTAEGKGEERWFFDRENGLLVRVAKKSAQGQETSFTYSDYRPVSKIKLPFAIAVSIEGKSSCIYGIVRAEVNVAIEKDALAPADTLIREAQEVDDLLKRSVESSVAGGGNGKSSLVHATLSAKTNGIETRLTVYRRNPGMVLVEKESAGLGRTVSGYDGAVGWENSEILGYHLLKEGEVNDLMSLSWLGIDPYLRERFPLRSKLGETTVAGRPATTLRLRTFTGLTGKFYFDRENAQLLRVEMEENSAIGTQAMNVDFSDYRTVGAASMPFHVTFENSGTQTVIVCDSVKLDVEMPDALFHPRPDADEANAAAVQLSNR